jgi:hypothetical protein
MTKGRFVIWNVTHQKYVALPGKKSSYTSDIAKARRFKTLPEAQRECCGDERVRDVFDIVFDAHGI